MLPSQLRTSLPLDTIKNGKPPQSRIESACDARTIACELVRASQDRSRFNAKIKGMIDGNPPYSADKLRSNGQAWRTNINFMEGKAALSAALAPYYDLFSGSPRYANVQCGYGSNTDREYYSRVISEEFDYLLKSYDGFDFNIQSMLHDMLCYGKGFLMWNDKTDCRFNHVGQHRIFVPDGTDACGPNLEVLVVRQSFQVHKLWGFIKNKESAKKLGWDVSFTAEAIGRVFPVTSGAQSQTYDYDYLQQRLKDRDITEGVRSATVQAAHIYVKEFDGKITHCIVLEDDVSDDGNGNKKEEKYLFKKVGRYDRWAQVVATFFFETLDGSWNGASGLGRDIYAPMEIKNRMHCSKYDAVFMRSGITLQAKTADSLQKTALVQVGAFNIIPPNYDVQQATILGDLEGLMAANREMDGMIQANTGIYKPRLEQPSGNPRTAEEVRLQFQAATVLGNSAVNRFYLNLDKLYAEIFRRAANPNQTDDNEGGRMALAFQKACEDRGVPRVALLKIKAVRAMRNVGNGSSLMRKSALQSLMTIYPLLPEDGKKAFVEDAVAAETNQEFVDRYVPRSETSKLPDDQTAMAMIENAMFKVGAPVQWTPTQNNVIHAQVHLQAAAMAAQSLQQGANPVDVVSFIDNAGANIAVHLQQISNDPTRKQEFQILNEQFMALAKIADQLKDKIEKDVAAQQQQQAEMMQAQQQAQAIEQGTDPDTVIKAASAKADAQLKALKTQSQLEQKQAKFEQDMAIKDARAAAEIRRRNQMTNA